MSVVQPTPISADDESLIRQSIERLVMAAPADAIVSELQQLGWLELYETDPRLAVASVFEAQGSSLRTSPMVAVLMRHVLARPFGTAGIHCSPLVVLPPIGASARVPGRLDHGDVVIDGLVTWPLTTGKLRVGVATSGDGVAAAEVDPTTLEFVSANGLDLDFNLARVTGRAPVEGLKDGDDEARWANAMAVGRLALSHEITATAQRALELARTHALQRIQFGRAIGTFQAIKHRLADATVALSVAEEALSEGWRGIDHANARLAKVLAGRAGTEVIRQAQQVLGGMGFTWEHEFHRRLRRILTLDALLGSATELEREIGEELLTQRRLPDVASSDHDAFSTMGAPIVGHTTEGSGLDQSPEGVSRPAKVEPTRTTG